jgi:hypothetical protein
MMKTYRLVVGSVSLTVLAPLLMGLGSSPPLKDVRFAVTSVTLAGPATIPNGGSANYTVTATINRDGIAANATIVGTQGPPPPRVRPSIHVGNTQLTFADVDVLPNVNTISTSLTLTCSNNEVRGDVAGSGHGGTGQFLWWSWDDPAEIKGHLNERESKKTRVLCRQG